MEHRSSVSLRIGWNTDFIHGTFKVIHHEYKQIYEKGRYINTTITILDVIHLPVFYFKILRHQIRYIGLSVPHRKPIRLSYEPNRLMLSIGL
jgi:hypothetical protein